MERVGAAHDQRSVPGFADAAIDVSVFHRSGQPAAGPGILYLHGGGMIFGNRFGGVGAYLPFVASHAVVVVAVDYRLAPEHPDPIPVEDCFAALRWAVSHADELGIDPERLIVAGQSSGAGLAAGVTLLARDRGETAIAAQVLVSPMLDDRNDTGWTALLGDRRGRGDVAASAAPACADDLAGLPPAFLSVGSAEVFRDETVAYASRIWASGGVAELHVWPGGFHGFENFAPGAAISQASAAARDGWLARILAA